MLRKARSFFTIDIDKLRATNEGLPFIVDLLMVMLVVINLSLIFFDWSYPYPSFQSLIEFISPTFNQFYGREIHPNTSYLDLIFVSIFITELLIRWGIAIRKKRYEKWFFYPFAHWYDVLGCIPMSGVFKSFRLFRVFGMVYRLNNLGVIDIESTFLYKKGMKYYKILVEEVSDKVVVNVLTGAQNQIDRGSPLVHQIAKQVLEPNKEKIDEWLHEQLSEVVSLTYYKHRNDLNQYLQAVVKKSVDENPEIRRISLIPGLGKQIALALESSISNITFNVVDNAIEDMSKERKVPALEDISGQLLQAFSQGADEESDLNALMKYIVHETLEIVKKEVGVKQWRVKELQDRKNSLLKRLGNGRGDKEALEAKIELIEEKIQKAKGK